jgi:hypothetical protein
MSRRDFRDDRGAAASEFALALPMMLALMFGAIEAGHFFWTQHKIVKAVREGARFAARQDVSALCDGATASISETLEDSIRDVTATGVIDGTAGPRVPGWDPDDVAIEVGCQAFVNTGIYSDLNANGPLVTISSGAVPYPSLFDRLGFITSDIRLTARSSAAVTGI